MVIGYGGNAMTDLPCRPTLPKAVGAAQAGGHEPVVVHGGGPQIETALKPPGQEGQFIRACA